MRRAPRMIIPQSKGERERLLMKSINTKEDGRGKGGA
jgi:hypothetical protein